MKDFNIRTDKIKNKIKFVKTMWGDKYGRSEKSQTFSFLGDQLLKIYLNYQSVYCLIKKLYPNIESPSPRDVHIGSIGDLLMDSEILDSSDMFKETFQIISSSLKSLEGFEGQYDEYISTNLKGSIMDSDEKLYQPLDKHIKKLLELSIACKEFESSKYQSKGSKQTEQMTENIANTKKQFETEENIVADLLLQYEALQTRTSMKFLEALETSHAMHVTSLRCLQNKLDQLGKVKNKYCITPVFGLPLEEHAKTFKSDVSLVIKRCFAYIYQESQYKTEGLFRLGCTNDKMKLLKDSINDGVWNFDLVQGDMHIVTSVIKTYLKELPDELLGNSKLEIWHQISTENDPSEKKKNIIEIVNQLSDITRINLLYLCFCLNKISEVSDVNKMTPENLSICISPNLLKIYDQSKIVKYTGSINSIVKTMIQNYKEYFPNDDFEMKSNDSDLINFE